MTMEYDLRIEGLSRYRYRELRNICRQYDEMKKKIKAMSVLSSARITAGRSTGTPADPVGEYVVDLLYWKQRVEAIEQAALQSCNGSKPMAKAILRNVVHDVSYERMPAPCGRATFYRARKRFFRILDKLITYGYK